MSWLEKIDETVDNFCDNIEAAIFGDSYVNRQYDELEAKQQAEYERQAEQERGEI